MDLNWGELLLGAGGASTVIGAYVLRKLKDIDQIPSLIAAVERQSECIEKMKVSVDGFSGELRALERAMYENQKNIALASQKVEAAFRQVDDLKESVRDLKL